MTAPARRRAAASIALTAALVGAALAVPLPASAATLEAGDGSALQTVLATANATPGADTVVITADITGVDLLLDVTDALTISLGESTVDSVRLRATADLTIEGDGGIWTAGRFDSPDIVGGPGIGIAHGSDLVVDSVDLRTFGTNCDAGIGGWQSSPIVLVQCPDVDGDSEVHGSMTFINSLVTGAGGAGAAGIGSAAHPNPALTPGAISFVGSNALGFSRLGSGIGGGLEGSAGSISIDGGDVVGAGGIGSTGIGGSRSGNGGAVTISGGARVEASASDTLGPAGPDIGGGLTSTSDGTLVVSGATIENTLIEASTTVTAQTTMVVTGTVTQAGPLVNKGTIRVDGVLAGAGAITNDWVIRPSSNVTASGVSVNNITVTYDLTYPGAPAPTSTRYLSPFIVLAGESLPVPQREGFVISGWNTEPDGSGATLDELSGLVTLADGGSGFTAYAIWQESVVEVSAPTVGVAGGTVSVSVTTPGPFGTSVDLTDAVVTSSEPTDAITGTDIVTTLAGARTITVVAGSETTQFELVVIPDVVAELELDAPDLTVDQGDSLTFTVSGTDRFGNPVLLDPTEVVLSSSVATDVIDGLTVRFPTPSPHVITATVGDVSTSVTVTVTPAAVAPAPQPVPSAAPTPVPSPSLAATGAADPQTGWMLGLALLVVGAAMLAIRLREVRA